MDVQKYNRDAWDAQVQSGNSWTKPVSSETIDSARGGNFRLVLTPEKAVPADWFPPLDQCRTLCLASGGGQQGPVLAAAGAEVTVLDNSPRQLMQDVAVAKRDGLTLETIVGDMADLSCFEDGTFDFVFHPCSVSFVPDVQPVFDEVFRVLQPGGVYLFGACNPVIYLFDYDALKAGQLEVRFSIPYSDQSSLTTVELKQLKAGNEPLCFGHSLEALIGGQLRSGFHIADYYDDKWASADGKVVDQFIASTFATKAIKPDR
jgi:SAM-dependent methyltransferase